MYFQDLILELQKFWASQGCVIRQPYDMEVGAARSTRQRFSGPSGPEPSNAAYVQPSRRPTDGRYGENPNRLQHYFQFQVIMKPSPLDIQDMYLESLRTFGIDPAPTTSGLWRTTGNPRPSARGAWAGRSGSTAWRSPSSPISSRWAASSSHPITSRSPTASRESSCTFRTWITSATSNGTTRVLYGDIYLEPEREYSTYNFEEADKAMLRRLFDSYEAEGERAREGRELVYPAYDYCLKCSHVFNLLEARGALSVTERTNYIARVRNLAKMCADLYVRNGKPSVFPSFRGGAK